MPTIISTAQTRHKDAYAPASDLGLCLRANGEEKVKVIDSNQNVVTAGLPAPTVAPSAANGGSGTLPANKWCAYQYVYAATTRYPFVFSTLTGGGSDAPRSNPSASDTHQIAGTDQEVDVTVTYTTRADISEVWLYRTNFFDTEAEASIAAEAGLLFYINSAANNTSGGTTVIVDNVLAPTEVIELDNFEAAQFAYCVYDGSYFWGFGNYTFTAAISFNNSHSGSTGLLTLTGSDTWFDGRDGQNVRITGITTGGYDGQGTFRFKYLTSTTATVYTTDSATPVALPSTGSGTITIQGPATTLYRSKLNNPFAWGFTLTIGADTFLPIQFGERVGGGYGTAIAIVPNEELLVVCTRYPSRTYSFNLRAASQDNFFGTKRTVSDVYAFTNFHSVFQARQGSTNYLRGMDYENLEIIQCDGIRAYPVMQEVSPILRELTSTRSRQELAHGAYDPRTQTNCMWLTTQDSLSLIDLGIFEDTKTGAITIKDERDLLCSGILSDTTLNTKVLAGGTQTGIYGTIMVPDVYSDWTSLLTGLVSGTIGSATNTTITRSGSGSFDTTNDGLIGNWALVTDANGENEIWARISAISASQLTFDLFTGGNPNAFSTVPSAGWLFYVGLIECRLLKYFDFGMPSTGKNLLEQWVTMRDAEAGETVVRWYPERDAAADGSYIPVQETYNPSGDGKDTWFVKSGIPSQQTKTFGIEIINRSYQPWKFYNTVLKINQNP